MKKKPNCNTCKHAKVIINKLGMKRISVCTVKVDIPAAFNNREGFQPVRDMVDCNTCKKGCACYESIE